ncbi:serine hydrolase [Massilia sp. 9096]|uniref:serine hydrolase domain-containing protein n=1 Tax=Massilia sp. 9096 TaxID=1500894 RepID=UPI0006917B33|nr:serine hydrolase domain-containing protein [Massilia sp. 9096]
MQSAFPFRRTGLALLLAALLPAPFSFAQDGAEVHRIETGLRPAVAIQGQPVATRTLAAEMQRLHVPGVSVAVIRNGKVAWAKGYGVAYGDGPAVTPATLFQAASISKPVSALGALRMADAHQLDLDADINSELTSWKLPPGPAGSHATLRQLLSHTAGTTVSGFPGYAPDAPLPTLVQVLDGTPPANTKPIRIDTPPGSIWRYSGGGYAVVQQALIDRGGKPFADLMHDAVLAPLGMNDSSFAQPLPQALAARAALPHDEEGKPYNGGAYVYPELAAAGLWTTPSDLARFALGVQALAAGHSKLLSPRLARAMLQPVKNGYALGFEVEGKGDSLSFGHGGSNAGYQNSLYAFTGHGDGAVVMTNGDQGGELAHGVMRAIAAEYRWPGHQTVLRKTVALAPARRAALAGRYAIEGLGDFEIALHEGQLMFSARGSAFEPLYAASPSVFFVTSRELELRMDKGGDSGRLLSGPYDVQFTRASGGAHP